MRSAMLKGLFLCALAGVAAGCGGSTTSAARPRPPEPPSQQGPPPAATGALQRGQASYYSDKLAGRKTASGEPYKPRELTAAHRSLPFGAVVDVIRNDGRRVQVRINDRGPFQKNRIIDLSRRAAEALEMIRAGVIEVSLQVVSMPPKKRGR